LHMYLEDFGTMLAPMSTAFPGEQPASLDDADTPRLVVRSDGGSGFVFVNNHDRYNAKMHDLEGVKVDIQLDGETISMPRTSMVIKRGSYFILPFNFHAGGALLKHATAQLLASIDHGGVLTYFFFQVEGIEPEYSFDVASIETIAAPKGRVEKQGAVYHVTGIQPGTGETIKIKDRDKRDISIITLTRDQALHAWKGLAWGAWRLFISVPDLYFDNSSVTCYADELEDVAFSVYPAPSRSLLADEKPLASSADGVFTRYAGKIPWTSKSFKLNIVECNDNPGNWLIDIPGDAMQGIHDVFLTIHYAGCVACLYVNDKPVADDFYNGTPWVVGIKRWCPQILARAMRLEIVPLEADDDIYLEKWPAFEKGTSKLCKLVSITATRQCSVVIGEHERAKSNKVKL
nr:hypothetical protein [Candidatus Sigynarchaeota archaeon]